MDEMRYQIDLLTALNENLTVNEKIYRLIFDNSFSAYLYYDFVNKQLRTLGNWKAFFSFDVKNTKDLEQIYDTIKEEEKLKVRELFNLEKTNLDNKCQDFFLIDKGIWVECETSIYQNEKKEPAQKLIRLKNITRYKLQNDELAYMAYYDSLTGLYNRNYFVRILSEWIRKAEKENAIVSVIFIDIDDFRKINDGLGILVGDELVQLFGQYLEHFKSDNVILSHFNSDIYCMAIYEPTANKCADSVFRELQKRLEKPFSLTGQIDLSITVCLGVAEFPEAGNNAMELINYAEIVMFKAKANGKNGIQYFDEPILKEFLYTVKIEHKLKDALLKNNFFLNYQPQFDTKNKKLRGVEALIRWKDQEDSFISPSVFIPIAEKNGTIIPIGTWVIEEGLKTYCSWRKKYNYPLILSLNISALQFRKSDFVNKLLTMTKLYDIEPCFVELEITESVLIDDFDDIVFKMRALREYGFRVSLDDFGTGFSSLSYLKDLPIDTLKIDKTFIDTLSIDESSRIITESIISMVKKLGFETVAEGVEKIEQYEYLKEIQCDCIQGYLLGKPMSAGDIEKIIIDNM